MNLRKILYLLIAFQCTFCLTGQAQSSGQLTDLFKFCSEKKGFNLLGKYDVSWSNNGFPESEFSMIRNLGFNFVRLPLDYRTYTKAGDWNTFLETEALKIDRAVQYGSKHGVHVCINLHRAPGYCINPTTLPVNQQLNLWTDVTAQDAFVKHWEYFANRYKAIAADKLSFNLVNEPSNVTSDVYVAVMRKAIQAIHQISPERIIFVDGTESGRKLIPALKDEPNVAQSIHCYDPSGLTHYKAEWVDGAADWAVPTWPVHWISNFLYGPWKGDFKSALGFEGNFATGTEIIVNVNQVSMESTLTIKAGAKLLLNKRFVCTAELGTDFTKIVKNEWGYQNISNKDYTVTLTEPATKITFENSAGDWMTVNSITIKQGTTVSKYTLSNNTWGQKQATYKIDESGTARTLDGNDLLPFDIYRQNVAISKANQIPFMVQEFGVYNKTPYQVTIDFLTDLSAFLAENNIGWALWNFNGSFGILNSGRSDCPYESYQGYSLDRKMLDILTKSGPTAFISLPSIESLTLYPSPAKDILFIAPGKLQGNVNVEIMDLTGRLVKQLSIKTIQTERINLDVSTLAPNMYILKAIGEGTSYSGKFQIMR
ncbi:MAG TPA: cellulase family glycosylhydrolase [Prolixibacteraceae bacterium]|nr:cellulase family glycosylhydrolase [Prolixibacteraceae bacterium]